ncbi:hypothetical protein [Nocardia carnea]|uniref:hypothetical protein n=1 Tax=Nocardia carnea TaxID=37328 RepID=UPI0024562350|nr:hypothetical protein [Nocardia carnea]
MNARAPAYGTMFSSDMISTFSSDMISTPSAARRDRAERPVPDREVMPPALRR